MRMSSAAKQAAVTDTVISTDGEGVNMVSVKDSGIASAAVGSAVGRPTAASPELRPFVEEAAAEGGQAGNAAPVHRHNPSRRSGKNEGCNRGGLRTDRGRRAPVADAQGSLRS